MSLILVKSVSDIESTLSKISEEIEGKGLKIFSVIRHGDAAVANGLSLNPTNLIIFGNPQVGTKLMQCDQAMGIELPMKILVWEDDDQQVFAGFNDPEQYLEKYNLDQCKEVIQKVKAVMTSLINAVKS